MSATQVAKVTKTETVRATFSGQDYLNLNELTSRLSFSGSPLKRHEEKEAVLRFAVSVLESVLGDIQDDFVVADADSVLMRYIEEHGIN